MLGFLGIVILAAIVFAVISFGSLLFATFAEGKERAKNNDKPEMKAHCRILEKNVENAEKKLAELEARQQELVAMMSGDDKVDFEQINREMSEVQAAMEETMQAWEDAAWELEKFRKDNA